MEDLVIKMRLDREDAKQALGEHIEDAKAMEGASGKAAAAIKQAHAQAAREVISINDGVASNAVANDRKRDASGRFVAAGQRQQAQAIRDSWTDAAKAGAAAFGQVAAKLELTKAGLSTLKGLAGDFGQAMEQAAAKSKKLADQFSTERDRLRELATVMGEKAGDDFTFRQAQYNQATGFRPDEGLEFRMQFQNSGAQNKGKNLSDAEYAEYEKQAGQLAVAKGFSPSETGDLAGTMLGFKDRRGLGDKASEDALGKLGSGLAILGRGRGQNSVLINQLNMLSAAALNEDEMKGTITDSDQAAVLISMMAEKSDASAAESVRAANRGLRDFTGKPAELLARAKIDAKTPLVEAFKQLAPVVIKEAKDKNIKVEDALRPYFEDQLTRDAIAVGINRGVEGGVIKDREDFGRQNQGPKPALDSIDEFQRSKPGLDRKFEADTKLAETGRAAINSDVNLLRKQAVARLTATGEIDSTSSAIKDFLIQKATYNAIADPERQRIDNEALKGLARQDPALLNGRIGFDKPFSIEASNEFIQRQIDMTRKNGFDPFGGRIPQGAPGGGPNPPAQANPPGKDPQMDAQTGLLTRIATALESLTRGNPAQNTPTIPPAAPPGPPKKMTN